jgi:hypothetical protein
MPYSSGFEAAVGNFLQTYAGMRGLQQQAGEAADRRRQAKRADQLGQIEMADRGYTTLQMPTVQPPSFEQGVGRRVLNGVRDFLSGGPDEPSSIVMKVSPSIREGEIANEQQFTTGRDTARFSNDRAVEELRGAIQTRLDANRQTHEDARNAADNRTRLAVAGMEKGAQREHIDAGLRDSFFDQAVAASNGDVQAAMQNVGKYQMASAVRYKASRADYYAAAARFRDRKAELAREGYQNREEIAAQRNAIWGPPPGIKPPPGIRPVPVAPTGGKPGDIVLPNASTPRPALKSVDLAHAKRDPGFKEWLMRQGYTQQELGF